jgi:hypothetical protein
MIAGVGVEMAVPEAACTTLNATLPMIRKPDRGLFVGLAATFQVTVPVPVPVSDPVATVSQDLLLAAVHVQLELLAVTLTVSPLAAAADGAALTGPRLKVHNGSAASVPAMAAATTKTAIPRFVAQRIIRNLLREWRPLNGMASRAMAGGKETRQPRFHGGGRSAKPMSNAVKCTTKYCT